MKPLLFTLICMIILSAMVVTADTCGLPASRCNETCSPCGGGCTSTDLSNMYYEETNFDAKYGDITGWDTSCITSMYGLFERSDFNQDISGWDTSHVTDMGHMFLGTAFNQPIGGWDTSHVTDMRAMFSSSSFNQDISGWDTSHVTNMFAMFFHTANFNQDISGWDVSSVTDMLGMFQGNPYFNQPIGSWNTTNLVIATQMFYQANAFDQSLGNWDIHNITTIDRAWAEPFFGDGSGLSTPNYDDTLLGWSSQGKTGLLASFGSSTYSAAGKVGRDILTGVLGWSINDNGNCTDMPTWVCSEYEVCQPDSLRHCIAVIDTTGCNLEIYQGDYSEFVPLNCTYGPIGDPTGGTNDNWPDEGGEPGVPTEPGTDETGIDEGGDIFVVIPITEPIVVDFRGLYEEFIIMMQQIFQGNLGAVGKLFTAYWLELLITVVGIGLVITAGINMGKPKKGTKK